MRLRRKNKLQPPGRRQVVSGGRPAAFSYHANRTEQEVNLGRLQPREQDNRRRERLIRYWRQRLGMLFAGLVLIVCVLDILHLSPNANVIATSNASSTSNSFLQSSAVYRRAVNKLLASSMLNDNKITINTAAIQQSLKKQFPELADVSLTLPLIGHRPIVYIAATNPALLLQTTTSTYVLDENGRALLAADQVTAANVHTLPTVVDKSGLQVRSGQLILPSTSVGFIQTVAAELQAKGVAVNQYSLPRSAYELDVTPAGAGYYVKFNLHDWQSALQQVGTLLATQKWLSDHQQKPTSYIDVRLDGRAYYK